MTSRSASPPRPRSTPSTLNSSFLITSTPTVASSQFHRHLLIVFGGTEGIEESIEADEHIKTNNTSSLFTYYLSPICNPGCRSVRTEVRSSCPSAHHLGNGPVDAVHPPNEVQISERLLTRNLLFFVSFSCSRCVCSMESCLLMTRRSLFESLTRHYKGHLKTKGHYRLFYFSYQQV